VQSKHEISKIVLGVRFGEEVAFVLVKRFRKVVEEEWVTLMSYCPKIVFRSLEREGWKGREMERE
jgi:hypothetical protein